MVSGVLDKLNDYLTAGKVIDAVQREDGETALKEITGFLTGKAIGNLATYTIARTTIKGLLILVEHWKYVEVCRIVNACAIGVKLRNTYSLLPEVGGWIFDHYCPDHPWLSFGVRAGVYTCIGISTCTGSLIVWSALIGLSTYVLSNALKSAVCCVCSATYTPGNEENQRFMTAMQ